MYNNLILFKSCIMQFLLHWNNCSTWSHNKMSPKFHPPSHFGTLNLNYGLRPVYRLSDPGLFAQPLNLDCAVVILSWLSPYSSAFCFSLFSQTLLQNTHATQLYQTYSPAYSSQNSLLFLTILTCSTTVPRFLSSGAHFLLHQLTCPSLPRHAWSIPTLLVPLLVFLL